MPPPAPPSLHRRSPTPPPPCAVGDDADGRYDPRLPPCAAAMLERRRRSTHRGRSALSQIQWGRPTPNPSSPLPRGRDAAPGPDTASSFFLASSPDYRLQLPAAINADCLPQLHDHQGDETMLRLSRFLPSASRRGFDIKEAVWSDSLTFQQALSTSAANLDENSSGKKFASYTVFKGKAALSIHPILPSFSKMEFCEARRRNYEENVKLGQPLSLIGYCTGT